MPAALSRMPELAHNMLYTWEPTIRALFRRLDRTLWTASGRNPVSMLSRISQEALERAARDPRYVSLYRQACERLDAYIEQRGSTDPDWLVAFFSMEYGLVECLPNYSGGLGVLAGDFLKAASDFSLPVVGVGLLYQKGYVQQSLNPDGWQQEKYPTNDFYTLPITPVTLPDGSDLKVYVPLPTGRVAIKVWRMEVGRVALYLLDTNIPENERPENRDITDQLYGGDIRTRIRQEIVLGIGGVRALHSLGLKPSVYHLNEGHSAFLALERLRICMAEEKLSFDEALEAVRTNNVFTTHTSVPAGIDLFDTALMFEYFQDYCRESGIQFDQLMLLGRRNPLDLHERFSMPVLAFKTSSYRNAVSRLHRRVSQEMWQDLWPQLPVWEVPITSVTNGVHLPTWLSADLSDLYDQYLQPDWRERYEEAKTWELVEDIPDQELFDAHQRRKRHLVSFVRQHQTACAMNRNASSGELRRAAEVLDPNAFTIGFARRFATYKRATLLFRDFDRLKRILTNLKMPVQVVIAGKAHPEDNPGKSLIREVVQYSRDPEIVKHLVFVEGYDIEVGRELVRGVDLWLNTPRRGEEACGTSGMKAGINGVLNLSILDGWFDEAYGLSGGWVIGDREPYSSDQDEIHARAIYSLLENEIVPLYYERRDQDVPRGWIRRVKNSLMHLSPLFNSQRMVRQYARELYQPAHTAFLEVRKDGFAKARRKAQWHNNVSGVWHAVKFLELGDGPAGAVTNGQSIQVRTTIDLAGLGAKDVRVEAVIGRVGASGQLEDTEVVVLPAVEERGSACVFARDITPRHSGRTGYALRVSPNHFDDPVTRPCGCLLKWANGPRRE